MLLPKITIRQLMFTIAVVAIYSAILSWAARGNVVAYSLALSIALLAIPFAVYAAVYWSLLQWAKLRGLFDGPSARNSSTESDTWDTA